MINRSTNPSSLSLPNSELAVWEAVVVGSHSVHSFKDYFWQF